MPRKATPSTHAKPLQDFLDGKSPKTIALFNHFVKVYGKIGKVDILPAKSMIGIATSRKRVAYITTLGKDFIHVVFPFEEPYPENLCFEKIAQVPGAKQFNHHLRIRESEDVNQEVQKFMKLAYKLGS